MKRSKLEIYIDLLVILKIRGPLIASHITYETFLNWQKVNEALNFLEDRGLVQSVKRGKRKAYEITEKGLRTLQTAKELNDELYVFSL